MPKCERLFNLSISVIIAADLEQADPLISGIAYDDARHHFVGRRHTRRFLELVGTESDGSERFEAPLAADVVEQLDPVVVSFRYDYVSRLCIDVMGEVGERGTISDEAPLVEKGRVVHRSQHGIVRVSVQVCFLIQIHFTRFRSDQDKQEVAVL